MSETVSPFLIGATWLASPRSFFGMAANNHYYWTHFLLDESRHTGQIILIRKYLLDASDAEFQPYAALAVRPS